MISVSRGCVVAIKEWWGEHWGIVATDHYGRLTIISNRGLCGGVTEDLWEDVVGNATWRVVNDLSGSLPVYEIVERARSKIGTRYDSWRWNCQDLVYWALGFEPQSPQRNAVVGVLSVACLVAAFGMAGKRRSTS